MSDILHSSSGFPAVLYEGDIPIPISSSGGHTGYFEAKDYELKIITDPQSNLTMKIWDSNTLIDGGADPLFEKKVKGPQTLQYHFNKRGFYSIELVNESDDAINVMLTYLRHKGVQMDFQMQSILVSVVGILLTVAAIASWRRSNA
ncbi:MAG: hypothetical protein ACXQTP_05595 [Candidatus Methanofastidiosia archaeon]